MIVFSFLFFFSFQKWYGGYVRVLGAKEIVRVLKREERRKKEERSIAGNLCC